MTSDLERLVGPSRADVLAGYVLREPRLRDIAVAEGAFARQIIADAIEVGADMDDVIERLERGDAQYLSPNFTRLAYDSEANAVLLTALCLRVSVTEAIAALPHDREPIYAVVYELWGYRRRKRRKAEPWQAMEWGKIFRRLREIGFTREQVSDLTFSEVLNELGADGKPKLSPADVKALRAAKQDETFDKACAHLAITHDMLSTLPPSDVIAALTAIGVKPPTLEQLPGLIQTYCQRKDRARG
jgi:hypothetical protein